MKKLLVCLALVSCLSVKAQTPAPQTTFFESVGAYFTSFNTNLAFTNTPDRFNIFAGTDNVDNDRMAASLGVLWNVSRSFSLESVTRNATVAGTVLSTQAGVGYSLTHVDTKLTGYLHGGYRFDTHEPYVAPGLRVMKALTANTFAGVSLELDINVKHVQSELKPTLGFFAGFKL